MHTTTRPHRSRLTLLASALALTALLASCSSWSRTSGTPPRAVGETAALIAVADCEQLVEHAATTLRATAEAQWWQPPEPGFFERLFGRGGGDDAMFIDERGPVPPMAAEPLGAEEQATSADADGGASRSVAGGSDPAVIGTNNQEAAVDEADIVKTDGKYIYSILGSTLRVIPVDDQPAVAASLDLNERRATEMFLRGDQLLVIGSSGNTIDPMIRPGGVIEDFGDDIAIDGPAVGGFGGGFGGSTTLTIVSVADPAAPTVVTSAEVEGSLVAARQIDGTARIVVRSSPAVAQDVMMAPSKDDALAAADSVRADDLLPRMSADGVVRQIGECSDVVIASTEAPDSATVDDDGDRAEPAPGWGAPPQIDNITVLTVDDDLTDLAPTTIQGAAETVYASSDALYIASGNWDEHGASTEIHRFDMTGDGAAVHTGSGRAPGRLLNQFSLSDRAGTLRVVTTIDGVRGTEGRLTNLDTDGALDEIGHLDGMGIGEEVKSVRFLDDLGYVVTFRQTDPLYALDLSDPRNPVQLGELKIPGFSEYLHPIGDGLLLGVGSDADPWTGRVTGAKISLFDVSDPAAMAEVDQIVLPEAWSPVSQDHKAFLWDPSRNQAVIPLNGHLGGAAAVLRVEGRMLRNIAQIQHPSSPFGGRSEAPVRSIVIDDGLWTLSPAGLGRSDADAPAAVAMAPFS